MWVHRWHEQERQVEPARKKRFSPGEVRAAGIGSDSKRSRLILTETVTEQRRRGVRASKNARSPFRFPRHDSQTSAQAARRKQADLTQTRRRWFQDQGIAEPARLLFIDDQHQYNATEQDGTRND
jgi:hypothetical protein